MLALYLEMHEYIGIFLTNFIIIYSNSRYFVFRQILKRYIYIFMLKSGILNCICAYISFTELQYAIF